MIYRFKLKHVVYFGIVLIAVVIVSAMCSSFAFFSSVNEEHGRLNIVTGTLNYKLSANDLINNKVSLQPGEYKALDIKITSLNTIDSKYELYYTSTSNNVLVEYTSTIDIPSGTIDALGEKIISIIIHNSSSKNETITFGVVGGFANKVLTINSEYNAIPQVALVPGLYDSNDNMIAAWDKLVREYGLDVEHDYNLTYDNDYTNMTSNEFVYNETIGSYVSNNPNMYNYLLIHNPELQLGTKLVVGNVSKIGDLGLSGNNLKEIVLPKTLTRIGDCGMLYSRALEKIEIPENVTYIGVLAFSSASNLSSVVFAPNSKLDNINGVAFEYTNISSITIPRSVTSIGGEAFRGCNSLSEVLLEDNSQLTSIGDGAFDNTPWYTEASKNGTPTLNGIPVNPKM